MTDDTAKPGATGRFPNGKLSKDDEGELRLAVGRKAGNVCIDFGKPVHWLAMPPAHAVELAQLLLHHAKIGAQERGETLLVEFEL